MDSDGFGITAQVNHMYCHHNHRLLVILLLTVDTTSSKQSYFEQQPTADAVSEQPATPLQLRLPETTLQVVLRYTVDQESFGSVEDVRVVCKSFDSSMDG